MPSDIERRRCRVLIVLNVLWFSPSSPVLSGGGRRGPLGGRGGEDY